MTGSERILIAVGDAVFADSLHFSLELEGYEPVLCEPGMLLAAANEARCILLDQTVFSQFGKSNRALAGLDTPVILLVGQKTPRTVDRARAAGIGCVVETPFHDRVLFDEIHRAVSGTRCEAGEPV